MPREGGPAAVGGHGRLWLLLAAALLLRLTVVVLVGDLGPRIIDEQHYHRLAHSLREGAGFSFENGVLTSIRPPLYPLFLSALWRLAGSESLLLVRLAQACLGVAIAGLVYRAGRELFDERVGLAAAAVAAFYPPFVFSGVTILTETLFTFLLLLALVAYFAAARGSGLGAVLLAGAAFGLAALTRSVVWVFPFVAAPFLFATLPGTRTRRAGLAAAFLGAHVAVLAPWAIRNTRLQGVPTVVDTMAGFNLWMANADSTPADRLWDSIGQGGAQAFSRAIRRDYPVGRLSEGQKDKWGQKEAFRYMRAHPLVTLRRAAVKFADFWGLDREFAAGLAWGLYRPPPVVGALLTVAMVAFYPPLMLLAVLGACLAPRRGWAPHLFLLLLVAAVCGLHCLAFGHSRYRLPLMPLFVVYAAAALVHRSWRRLREGMAAAALPVALGGALLAVWTREVVIRDADRIRSLLSMLLPG
jgi:4-amino-4-deoxy-L-arabinose transferase-like glycosyltransferase